MSFEQVTRATSLNWAIAAGYVHTLTPAFLSGLAGFGGLDGILRASQGLASGARLPRLTRRASIGAGILTSGRCTG